jgi:Tol biopolymer transport system component
MLIAPGVRLGPYEVVAPLGAGGMGEVWRARDTTLDRDVAIKILPPVFATDPDRLARFEREAKVLASLNHPNVAGIFGLHEQDGVRFLAMELVPGEDLAKRLERGPLPLHDALDVARQVAAALEAAHGSGIVHRDLKPANVQRAPDGTVKVLDFGLAKALEAPGGDLRQSMTVTSAGSVAGMIVGTAAYMSPEQARAQPVDRRTDLWAFGCLVFEMLAGKKAFDGLTVTDVLAAVVTRDPDWSALPTGTPLPVRRLLRRCLEKDLKKRLRDAGDASLLLEDNPEDARAGAIAPAAPAALVAPWTRWLPWAVALVLAAVLAATFAMKGGSKRAPASPMILSAKLPPGVKLDIENNGGESPILAITRDGSRIVFVGDVEGTRELYVRSIDKLTAAPVPGTEGAFAPFFSPDGRWIAFFTPSKLKKIPVEGGEPIELAEAGMARGGVWCDDDTIVFSPFTSSALMRIPSGGGSAAPLTTLDPSKQERTHRWPALLPAGEVAFTVGTADKPGAYEDSRIDAVSLRTGRRRTLLVGASMIRYAASGELMLGRDNQLFSVRLADANGGVVAKAAPVLQGVNGIASSGVVFFDIADNGTLVYAEHDPRATALELVRVARDGAIEKLPFPAREYHEPHVSPDGTRIAVGVGPGRGRSSDVWIGDLRRGDMARLTFGTSSGASAAPVWSPDGTRVAFGRSTASGGDTLATKPADGTGEETILAPFPAASARGPLSWNRDGQSIIYQADGGAGHTADLMVLSVADGRSRPLADSPAVEIGGTFSPDGRWIAYASDESGRMEVYVQPFPTAGGRWQVSDGGTTPRWSTDGKTLYYVSATHTMMEVPVTIGATFSHGSPKPLFETRLPTNSDTYTNYDVTPDGHFVMVRTVSELKTAEHLDVIVNSFDLLRRAGSK